MKSVLFTDGVQLPLSKLCLEDDTTALSKMFMHISLDLPCDEYDLSLYRYSARLYHFMYNDLGRKKIPECFRHLCWKNNVEPIVNWLYDMKDTPVKRTAFVLSLKLAPIRATKFVPRFEPYPNEAFKCTNMSNDVGIFLQLYDALCEFDGNGCFIDFMVEKKCYASSIDWMDTNHQKWKRAPKKIVLCYLKKMKL